MPENSSAIISDTSVLIILTKIDRLNLLEKIYSEITVTDEVAREYKLAIPYWIKIDNPFTDYKENKLLESLDPGEASSIALALERKNCLLIIDEAPARRIALQLNLSVTGTLGILLEAKKRNLITSLKPLLRDMKESGFRISSDLESRFLLLANE